MDDRFEVTVGAETMRSAADRIVSVTVDADFTGGHLLHLVVRCQTS